MKKYFYYSAFIFLLISCNGKEETKPGKTDVKTDNITPPNNVPAAPQYDSTSIYYYKFQSLTGTEIKLSDFKGKKILIVNTASFCGYTPQYNGLEELYKKYQDKLVIIGFPSDDFEQEFKNDEQIKNFCEKNYEITFPMSILTKVSNNSEQNPVYRWLTKKSLNGKSDNKVEWNFQKYLIGKDGKFEEMFLSYIEPDDAKLKAAIEK